MNLDQQIREQMFGKQQPARTGHLKLRKKEVEARAKASIESGGGTFLRINWKKTSVHFLTPGGAKRVESLSFRFR